jgi:hypothetical protein
MARDLARTSGHVRAMNLLAVLLFLCTTSSLGASILFAAKPDLRPRAMPLFLAAIALWAIYEGVLQRIEPYPNIRADLIVLIPLGLYTLSNLISPKKPASAQTQASRDSSRCLTLGLINVVAWMIPALAIWGIVVGHRALVSKPDKTDRVKALLGLALGYSQVLAAAYFWFVVMPN